MKRNVVAVALVLVMMVTLMGTALALDPGTYFSDADDWEDLYFSEAAFYLGHAGIFIGDAQRRLLPNQPFTRSHMAVVLSRLMGQSRLAEAMQFMNTRWHDDGAIPSWARGAFALAEARGWFIGDNHGNVNPNENLTYAEISILLARVTDNAELAVGAWPRNALIAGNEMGIYADLEGDPVADLPVFRGEMVSMTFLASLVGEWDQDDDAFNAERAVLKRFHKNTWDAYQDALTRDDEVMGTLTVYLSASERITVDGIRYPLFLEDNQPKVTLTLNDASTTVSGSANFRAKVFDVLKDTDVTLFLNDEGQVTKIVGSVDTYSDVFLTAVDVAKDEEDFGTLNIAVTGISKLEVDDDTVIWLNGDRVNLLAVADAFEAFQEDWDDANAIITVRTRGNDPDNEALVIWMSVLTDHTVSGKVTAKGVNFYRIDGVKYDSAIDLTIGTDYTLLLDSTDTIRAILTQVMVSDIYFAKLVEYMLVNGKVEALVELPDGTDLPVKNITLFLETDQVLADYLGQVVVVTYDITEAPGNSIWAVHEAHDAGALTSQVGRYDASTSSWIRLKEGGGVYPLAEHVFYYNADTKKFVGRTDLKGNDPLALGMIDGVVGYVVIYHPFDG